MSDVEYRRLVTRDALYQGIDLWNDLHPTFTISPRLAEQNIFSPAPGICVDAWGAYSSGDLCGLVLVKYESDLPTRCDIDSDGWISLLGVDTTVVDVDIVGRALLETALEYLAATGAETIQFGNALRKFFAGLPESLTTNYEGVLRDVGFDQVEVWYDLYQDISTRSAAERIDHHRMPDADVTVRPVTDEDREALFELIRTDLPSRWLRQAQMARTAPGGFRDYRMLWNGDRPIGFARTATTDSPMLAPCVNWCPVGSNRHCGLGLLGIADEFTGNRWGLHLVARIMDDFRRDGYQHMTVDGAPARLREYFGTLGFERQHEWLQFRTSL